MNHLARAKTINKYFGYLVFFTTVLFSNELLADTSGLKKPNSKAVAEMLQNIIKDLGGTTGPFITLFLAVCVVTGIIIILKTAQYLTERDAKKGNAIASFFIGVFFVSIPQLLSVINTTMFDDSTSYNIISSFPVSDTEISGVAKIAVSFSVFAIQIVGFLAFYRGLKTYYDLALSSQRQPESSRAAFIFIVFGVLCINILWTIRILSNTLGGDAIYYYDIVFGHIAWKP